MAEPTAQQIRDEALYRQMGLTEDEYKLAVSKLGRLPNYVETGLFSVLWSEHCSYKSSRRYLKNFPTDGPQVLQGPGENAGVIDIGDGTAIAFKMESHNHPSAVEPYQGAATGVGGILRDVFTMGARPIAFLNSLRFGSLDDARTRYLFENVVAGIGGYGNCVGIPTVGGEVVFDDAYQGNPLVNAMCVGVLPASNIVKGTASGVGNPVFIVGSRTGRDGIHGATFASVEDPHERERSAVQVGDPFLGKLLMEACLELIAADVVVGIQDMGAAGLTSSSAEMASRAGGGLELNLDLVPCREDGMTAYEMMLSESQERMLVVLEKGKEETAFEIFHKWGLQVAEIGKVTEDGMLRLNHQGETVAEVPVHLLVDEAPVYDRPASPAGRSTTATETFTNTDIDANDALLTMLAHPTIADKRWVYRQYDTTVRTSTVVGPGSDAAVVLVPGTDKAIALCTDGNGRYVELDPRQGGRIAVAEAARNIVCSGGTPLAITNCLNFGNPEKPEIMYQFAEATAGMSEACRALSTPVVSGNVSLYNETQGKDIYPTPVIGMVGVVENLDLVTPSSFQTNGSVVFLIGPSDEDLGGSTLWQQLAGKPMGGAPNLDLDMEVRVQAFVHDSIRKDLILSAHDVSDGGLGTTLAEMCIGGGMGLTIDDLKTDGGAGKRIGALFSEAQSRICVEVASSNVNTLRQLASEAGVPIQQLGTTGGNQLTIADSNGTWLQLSLEQMEDAHGGALERRMNPAAKDEPVPAASTIAATGDQELDDRPKEECGVFGVFGHEQAAELTYFALFALQHRGQEAAGIASVDEGKMYSHRGLGLLTDAFAKGEAKTLLGAAAIGHVRYSTAGSNTLQNAQPLTFTTHQGNLAVAHNGNLVNAHALRVLLERQGTLFQSTSDSEIVAHLIAKAGYPTLLENVRDSLRVIKGGYAYLFLADDQLIAVRDPFGLRPLALGRLGGAYVVASESCAFETIGATFVRDVEPGEAIVINEQGLTSVPLVPTTQKAMCTFEHIYFARPDSDIDGWNVHSVRKNLGRILAETHPAEADIVIGVPDSSISAAAGFAEKSGIPLEMGLVKNKYIARTFIQPSDELRKSGVQLKLNAVRGVVEGKRVILIDDSIVRGTTSRRIVSLLRDAGAREVHVRISSPPYKHACHYGIDTSSKGQLIAATHSVPEICAEIGADSLEFLAVDEMMQAFGLQPGSRYPFCNACFTGQYPTEVYETDKLQNEARVATSTSL